MHSTSQQASWLRIVALVTVLAAVPLCLPPLPAFAGTPPPPAPAITTAAPASCLDTLISDRAVNDAGTLAVRDSSLGSSWRGWGRTRTSTVSYLSHTLGGEPVRIFGYYCRPTRASARSLPGLLILHGAGGYAVRQRAEEAASRGFAALVIDLPGRGPDRAVSRSTGPDLTVDNLFRLTPTLRHNYLYHAVHAARRGLTFLGSRAEVDPARLGIYGMSWGGVVTLLTAATDQRVQAAVNLFGAGYLAEGSTWTRRFAAMTHQKRDCFAASFDAASYAPRITCPVLSISATNDGCYWLPSFAQTQGLMNSASRQLLLPNLNHKINSTGRQALWAWLEGHLKRSQPVTDRLTGWRCELAGNRLQVVCSTAGRHVPEAVSVSYLASGVGWARAHWRTVRTARSRDRYVATIPGSTRASYLYATVTYRDGLSLSTPVHTVCAVTYPYGARLIDAPFMSPGRLHARAEELARQMGGRLVDASDGAAAVIAFGDQEVRVPARLVAGESYVPIRGLADAIGAPITWRNQTVTVSLPLPERIVQKLSGAVASAPAAPVVTPAPTAAPEAPPDQDAVAAQPTTSEPTTPEPALAPMVLGRRSSAVPIRPPVSPRAVPMAATATPRPAPEPVEASARPVKQGGLIRMM